MKKIINNKVYDTETAKLLGDFASHHARNDFHWFREELYRKKTGEFFLHGEGRANSKYSRSCGQNEWCGSEKIIPLSYTEAQEWAEEHLDADDYIKIFGEPDEEEIGCQRVNISLNQAILSKVKQEAGKKGVTVSEYISNLIENA